MIRTSTASQSDLQWDVHQDPVPALKAQLTREIQRLVEGCDTPELMYMLRTSESRVSKLRRGKTDDVSLARLIQIATLLGAEVRLTLSVRASGGGTHRECRFRAY